MTLYLLMNYMANDQYDIMIHDNVLFLTTLIPAYHWTCSPVYEANCWDYRDDNELSVEIGNDMDI